ncbi:MAG: ImmA/IrrE family metallo-endopeptidase [Lachnospiraceae bacterium]
MNDKYAVAYRTEKELRKSANELRDTCDFLDKEGYFDVLKYLENHLADSIPNFSFMIMDEEEANADPEMAIASAVTKIFDGTVSLVVREEVYEAARRGNGRARYTIAHEIGHCILHSQEQDIILARYSNTDYQKHNAVQQSDPEWQADVFASELLAPREMIKALSTFEIMCRFGVSRPVAEIQKRKSRQNL